MTSKDFLNDLHGPFTMDTPPVRKGFYVVTIKDTTQFEMWYWDGRAWMDSDDGLGDTRPSESASGWYGKFQPLIETNDGLDDGLGL